MSTTYFFTGFPGFLAANIVKNIAIQNNEAQFKLLIHPSQMDKADKAVDRLLTDGLLHREQFELLEGDITQPNLGLHEITLESLRDTVNYVFHLAAIYDLAVPKDFAYKVNVIGTGHVNDWVLTLNNLRRYIYFSTAYVSGERKGRVLETELQMGQTFKNHYESTKYEAEVLVQQIRSQVPTTIIRPGVVMGNSQTGATIKFDGPYFAMRFLDKFAAFPIPYVGKGEATLNLVPVDYIVNATSYLAHAEVAENKVYHLTDPSPYPVREAYALICRNLIGKEPSWTVPASFISSALSIPSFRRWTSVEKETIAYFNHPADYDTTQAAKDLEGSGVSCPDFADYIQIAVSFYKEHRHDPDKMIPVR
ncbi:SDR family oxidoreductase [Paenibacillus sediminis]|uniref:Thioester reductase-like protein n=1 Tax=Paenibacillus sediminis TaxID=664909 RepID=A0ABS4H673_9BACL|nr:SDR family oxidoreductase [Paenibacillus sediminis]MBP1937570.1 thioester reductase-like protein [Paenibacillus sediminis]